MTMSDKKSLWTLAHYQPSWYNIRYLIECTVPRRAYDMLAKLNTFALVGIDAMPVVAEVDVAVGLPKTVLVGLPEAAVRESVHRVERSLVNLGYSRHLGRTVINLAPADLKKDAGNFDLPIALALL